jgi:hypothetical protein
MLPCGRHTACHFTRNGGHAEDVFTLDKKKGKITSANYLKHKTSVYSVFLNKIKKKKQG